MARIKNAYAAPLNVVRYQERQQVFAMGRINRRALYNIHDGNRSEKNRVWNISILLPESLSIPLGPATFSELYRTEMKGRLKRHEYI